MRTGWEHDVPEDDTVLRQWVLTNLTRYRTFVERLDGRIDVWDAAALFDTGSSIDFDNAVVLRRPITPTELDELIDTAHVFFPPERPWLLMSTWPLPDLTGAGLELVGHPPFMMRVPDDRDPGPLPPGLEIRDADATTASVLGTVLGEAFGMPGSETSPWSDPRSYEGGDLRGYIGYVDGEPVATSASFTAHGVVDVEMVSCLDTHRGRGIGEAMTWAATRSAPDRPAMLMSSDLGRGIYERMGYVPVLRMTLWSSTRDASVNP